MCNNVTSPFPPNVLSLLRDNDKTDNVAAGASFFFYVFCPAPTNRFPVLVVHNWSSIQPASDYDIVVPVVASGDHRAADRTIRPFPTEKYC